MPLGGWRFRGEGFFFEGEELEEFSFWTEEDLRPAKSGEFEEYRRT